MSLPASGTLPVATATHGGPLPRKTQLNLHALPPASFGTYRCDVTEPINLRQIKGTPWISLFPKGANGPMRNRNRSSLLPGYMRREIGHCCRRLWTIDFSRHWTGISAGRTIMNFFILFR